MKIVSYNKAEQNIVILPNKWYVVINSHHNSKCYPKIQKEAFKITKMTLRADLRVRADPKGRK